MKIAVPVEGEEIFQHFGRAPAFKVYEVENGAVKVSKLVASQGTGHTAKSADLAAVKPDVVICGGIGTGAVAAVESSGAKLVAGASGRADDAVSAYLAGRLENREDAVHACGCGCH